MLTSQEYSNKQYLQTVIADHFANKEAKTLATVLQEKNRELLHDGLKRLYFLLSLPGLFYLAYQIAQVPEVNQILYTVLPGDKNEHQLDLAAFPIYGLILVAFYLAFIYGNTDFYEQNSDSLSKEIHELQELNSLITKISERSDTQT